MLKVEEGITILEVYMTETEKYLITKFWLITSKILGLTKALRPQRGPKRIKSDFKTSIFTKCVVKKNSSLESLIKIKPNLWLRHC